MKNFNTYLNEVTAEPSDLLVENVNYHNYIATNAVYTAASKYLGVNVTTNPFTTY